MTLAVYKFFNIRVTPKFRKVVIIATISFAVALLINFVLSLFGVNLGLVDGGTGAVSMLAVVFSLIGATLAVLNLVLDFDYIEQGVAMGAPAVSRGVAHSVSPSRWSGCTSRSSACSPTFAGSSSRLAASRPLTVEGRASNRKPRPFTSPG